MKFISFQQSVAVKSEMGRYNLALRQSKQFRVFHRRPNLFEFGDKVHSLVVSRKMIKVKDGIMRLMLSVNVALRLMAVLALMLTSQVAQAADDGKRGFVDKVYKDETGEHRYVVFVPPTYDANRPSPVMLFLHGAGERGTDGRAPLNVGLGSMIKARESTFPAIAVFPQCENVHGRVLEGWLAGSADANRALKILEQVEKDYRTDSKRRILSGWSMGGFGAWSLAAADQSRWSCVIPLSGGGKTEWAEKLKSIPVWAWHGESDGAVIVNRTREMIDAIKATGGTPRYTEIPSGDHDSWKIAFGDDRFIAWMLDPKNIDPDKLPIPKDLMQPKLVVADPFIPALEIPKAMYARLGNQMLEAMSYAAPKQIPADMLSGRINDLFDSTNVEGYSFSIQFTGISYRGDLNQIRIKGQGKDRLNIQVGLTNAVLNIGSTFVTGESHSASAGPIQIVMGHQRPVWLSVDVQPYIENRRIRFRQLGSRFDIPNDNWYVTSPAGVSVSGFGMSREKVSSGLVNGLYGSKWRIESEVKAVVPKLIETLEKRIADLGEASDVAGKFWPLPVYKPRLRFFPQEVSTDENGVTVVMGLSSAAIDPRRAPKQPAVINLKSDLPTDLSTVKSLQVGLVPDMLEPLTKLLVDSDVARIHVSDIPENTFAKFADKALLTEAIPELKRHADADIWSELALVSGISVDDVGGEKDTTRMQFHVSKLSITTSLLPPGSAAGVEDPRNAKPLVIFEVELKQTAIAELLKTNSQTRSIRFGWDGEPEIKVTSRFADGYEAENKAINNEQVAGWLKESWTAWTGLSQIGAARIPDLDFGLTKMRLSNAGWTSPHLFASFSPPGVKMTNSSKEVFIYETKGPYSNWGAPLKLEPGKSHEFEISYPLMYRRNGEIYTLPVGSHSEFREPLKGGPPRLFQAREE